MLVILVVVASFWAFKQMEAAAEARTKTYALISGADAFMSEMKDAETGQRGFLLTGDDSFLEPYSAVRNTLTEHLQELRLLALIPAAQQHLDAIAPLVDAKMTELSRGIEMHRNHDTAAALASIASGKGRQLMDSIRREISGLIQIEEGALVQQEAEYQSSMRRLFALIIIATLLTLLFALLFAYLIYRETQHRLQDLLHVETQRLLGIQEEMNGQLQQANFALQISEEKFAVTLNSIGDAVIATDAEGRVKLLNPLAQKLTGWTLAEAVDRPVADIFHIINQDTRLPSTIPVAETLAHGTIHGLANHTVLIARDGSECAIADSCAPIRDRDGHVLGAVLVFRDVSETDAAQKGLRDYQFYTRSLFEANIDALMTTDPSGIITDVNNQMEELTGRTRDELIGSPFKNHFTEPERAETGIKLVLSEKKVTNYELTARARDGKETAVSYNAATFYDRERRLQGVFAAARDMTERERLYQMLQERNIALESATSAAEKANRAKTDFLSGMSHELRTPLNAILGFAQLMESSAPTPSHKRSIDQILKAGWYLLELINEILDLALIESGKVTLSREPVSLVEVLLECRAMIEPQAQKRSISMTFPDFDAHYFVNADRTRVKQVLINLLFNAIKYNKPQGTVAVEYSLVNPKSIRISVRDTGTGLTADQLTQLFQPFNRLGREASAEEGTGIGLVVTKRLVELMGGTIGADSTVGTGSVFWFELDLTSAPQLCTGEVERVAPVRPKVPSGTPLRTLLYVEDNPANLELVEQLIARRPELRLLTAANGNLGIEFARIHQPEAILMDINLPGISGIDAMKILRADPSTGHIPIIALSANALPRDIEKGLEAGFFNYLTKPIKVNQFMDALDVALTFSQSASVRANLKETA